MESFEIELKSNIEEEDYNTLSEAFTNCYKQGKADIIAKLEKLVSEVFWESEIDGMISGKIIEQLKENDNE